MRDVVAEVLEAGVAWAERNDSEQRLDVTEE